MNFPKSVRFIIGFILLLLLYPQSASALIVFQSEFVSRQEDNTFIIDSFDDVSGNVTLQFGNSLGQTLTYDTTNNWFEISDDLNFLGNQGLNLALHQGTDTSSVTSPVEGQIFWDTDDDTLYVYDSGTTWIPISGGGGGGDATTLDGLDSTDFLRSNATDNYETGTLTFDSGTTVQGAAGSSINFDAAGVNMNGINNAALILNEDGTGTEDVTLQFGGTLAQTLTYDQSASEFTLSDTLAVTGDITTTGLIDATGNIDSGGAITSTTAINAGTDVNAGGNINQDGNTLTINADADADNNISVVAAQNTTGETGILRYNATSDQWEVSSDNGATYDDLDDNTLDQAYDEGGAGAGRTITADSGAVAVIGDGLQSDNILINDNSISSVDTNGDITIDPNGTGETITDSDLNVNGTNITIDADGGAGTDMSITFGGTLAEAISWDNANTRFVLSDDVRIEGNNSVIGQVFVAGDHTATDSDGTINLGRNGNSWESIQWNDASDYFAISDDINVTGGGTFSGDLVANGTNIDLGDSTADNLTVTAQIDSNLIPDADITYDLGSDTLRWRTIYVNELVSGTGVGDPISFGESGLSFDFTNGEAGGGDTILAGSLVKVDSSGTEEVILTTSKNDSPIGIAVEDTAFGEVTSVIVLGKATNVRCTGAVSIGSRIQSSNTDGVVEQGANSTKIVGTALSSCTGGVLTAIISLQ